MNDDFVAHAHVESRRREKHFQIMFLRSARKLHENLDERLILSPLVPLELQAKLVRNLYVEPRDVLGVLSRREHSRLLRRSHLSHVLRVKVRRRRFRIRTSVQVVLRHHVTIEPIDFVCVIVQKARRVPSSVSPSFARSSRLVASGSRSRSSSPPTILQHRLFPVFPHPPREFRLVSLHRVREIIPPAPLLVKRPVRALTFDRAKPRASAPRAHRERAIRGSAVLTLFLRVDALLIVRGRRHETHRARFCGAMRFARARAFFVETPAPSNPIVNDSR